MDATVIASASKHDDEAHWSGHRTRKAVHGCKAHVAANADTSLVGRLDVTPGNVHDGRAGGAVVPDNPGAVYADSGYRGTASATAVTARGDEPRVVATHVCVREGDTAAQDHLRAHNAAIHPIRARLEKTFGTWKRSYGLRRMRCRGLGKAALKSA